MYKSREENLIMYLNIAPYNLPTMYYNFILMSVLTNGMNVLYLSYKTCIFFEELKVKRYL